MIKYPDSVSVVESRVNIKHKNTCIILLSSRYVFSVAVSKVGREVVGHREMEVHRLN